jgi:hypothetical protein
MNIYKCFHTGKNTRITTGSGGHPANDKANDKNGGQGKISFGDNVHVLFLCWRGLF